MTQEKLIAAYIRQVKKKCPLPIRKKLTVDLESYLLDYLDDHPCNTLEDLTSSLGTPEKYVDEYFLSMEEAARRNLLFKTVWLKRSILGGIAAIVLIILVTAGWLVYETSQTMVYYYYEYIPENTGN